MNWKHCEGRNSPTVRRLSDMLLQGHLSRYYTPLAVGDRTLSFHDPRANGNFATVSIDIMNIGSVTCVGGMHVAGSEANRW